MEPIDEPEIAPGPQAVITIERGEFPWWLVALLMIIAAMAFAIFVNADYREAFRAIIPGLTLTIVLTLTAFVLAMVFGLLVGLGRIWRYSGGSEGLRILSIFVRNLSRLYIELVRGIPMLVFIFLIAFVLAPDFADLVQMSTRALRQAWRGTSALSLFYAAFIAEVFRAGIQSVPVGQAEAGRAVGLSEGQIMRRVILPQAVRNMLPALGNDLISLMKDTSLVSVLAVRELTQMARLYTGSSFRFREGFFILVVLYVTLTLGLSLLLQWYEKRIAIPDR